MNDIFIHGDPLEDLPRFRSLPKKLNGHRVFYKGDAPSVKETKEEQALAEVAQKKWQYYQDNYRPLEDEYMKQVDNLDLQVLTPIPVNINLGWLGSLMPKLCLLRMVNRAHSPASKMNTLMDSQIFPQLVAGRQRTHRPGFLIWRSLQTLRPRMMRAMLGTARQRRQMQRAACLVRARMNT
jgi:hypothetical protein